MLINSFARKLLALTFFISSIVYAGTCSRTTIFSDNSILFAADLNSEFNNDVNCVNSISDDNIVSGAAIAPSKISASIGGDGLARDGTTGALSVNVDGTTLEISGDEVQVKTNGVDNSEIRQSSGLSVIGRSANTTGNVADITGTDGQVLRVSGTTLGFGTIATAGIADGAVTAAKKAAVGQQLSSSSGFFSTTSTSYTDATNLSVSLTTTGRLVFIGLISDGSGSGGGTINSSDSTINQSTSNFKILRGSTEVGRYSLAHTITSGSTLSSSIPCSSVFTFEAPSAGTYTYKLQVQSAVSTTTSRISLCKLIAFEL